MKISALELIAELDKKPKTINVVQIKTVIKEDGTPVREMKELSNEETIKILAEAYGTPIIS